MTPGARRAIAVAALAAAWISAGAAPLADAIAGAPGPTDFARDYVSVRAQVRGGVEAGNDYAATLGVPAVVLLDAPYYAHPPTALLALLPFATLGFRAASLAWLCASLLALGALAVMLSEFVAPDRSRLAALAVFALLALWPPVLHDLAKGQWSIFLATLVAAGWRALDRGRLRAAGIWLGLAAALKVTPLLLLGYLWLRRRRAAWAMTSTLAALAALSVVCFGAAPWRAWVAQARPNALAWQTWIASTASINGAVARLLTASAFSRPLVDSPAAAQALTIALTAMLVVATAVATRAAPSPRDDRRLFAAWTTLVVLSNPLGWTHTVIVALVALALLAKDAPPAALVAVLVALSVPRETLATLAGPLPVSPGRGLALSLHAAALLVLLGVSLRAKIAVAPHAPAIGSLP